MIREILEAEGIGVVVDAGDVRFSKRRNGFQLVPPDGAHPITRTHLLIAVVRRPNTDDLSLDKPVSKPMIAAISSSTTSCARMLSTSGRWVTATGAGRSPTRRTPISRSWQATSEFSTVFTAASATGSPPTRCISTPRWGGQV